MEDFKKIPLVIDFDSTICNTTLKLYDLYCSLYNKEPKPIDINNVEWSLTNIIDDLTKEEINELFKNPNLYNYIEKYIFPNCKESLIELQKYFNIKIVSIHAQEVAEIKKQKIHEAFPFIPKEDIIIIPHVEGEMKFDKSQYITKDSAVVDDRVDVLESCEADVCICYGRYLWNTGYNGIRFWEWDYLKNFLMWYGRGKYFERYEEF